MNAVPEGKEEVQPMKDMSMWQIPQNIFGGKPQSGLVFGVNNFIKEFIEILKFKGK
jgi:hypothetical protein